jgi:hypothetical protein
MYQQPMYQQPMYQQPMYQQPAPKKSGALKKVLIGLGIVLVLCVAGCAIISSIVNSAVKQTTTGTISTSNTSSSPSNTSTQANTAAKIGKLGDTIMVDSVSCTFTTVKILAADDFAQPKAGNQFIVVHVKIHNANTQQATYNPFDFHVKSGAGNITDEEFMSPTSYTANNKLDSGQLDQGGTVEGDIIFQVPVGDHNAELTWQPNFFGNSTQNAWKLGL